MPKRKFWLKRRFLRRAPFGLQGRVQPEQHWGMTFHEWYRMNFENAKRRNPFIKKPWPLRNVDPHGRPRKHPLFQGSQK
jgi:hypothetical protein